MTVGEGRFQLYTHVAPPLKAGLYRFHVEQGLTATTDKGALAAGDLPIAPLDSHVEVTSPRYLLPPDQVLSTFPPAGSEGAYGSRLPQVVIKRRTLPWERAVTASETTPWLALVVFTEGEASLVTNQPVAQCVSPGVHLDGPPDVQTGNYLGIRRSMVEKIMPTQKDVPLLAHAREVDLHDTELMMGDDDGFLAVVIANRLPVAGRATDGAEVPVRYTAALVSLEGQFASLLPQSPPNVLTTELVQFSAVAADVVKGSGYDHAVMGMAPTSTARSATRDARAAGTFAAHTVAVGDLVPAAHAGTTAWNQVAHEAAEVVYARMDSAVVSASAGALVEAIDPTLRFPVLLHWSFTSSGNVTFERLMTDLDSGLHGTLGTKPPDTTGRPPVEVVETGHVGLVQRTRRGDEVRAWYRGPLLPHPPDLTSDRLPLAHTADQLRTVIPDGREDLSLAAAFEIGRLLALSSPTVVAALLRWRQLDYQTARQQVVWGGVMTALRDVAGFSASLGPQLARHLGLGLAHTLAARPDAVVGLPRPAVSRGTELPLDGADDVRLVATGLGLDLADGDPAEMLDVARRLTVPVVRFSDLPAREVGALTRATLSNTLSQAVAYLATDAMAGVLAPSPVLGPTIPRTVPAPRHRDVLDDIVERGPEPDDTDDTDDTDDPDGLDEETP